VLALITGCAGLLKKRKKAKVSHEPAESAPTMSADAPSSTLETTLPHSQAASEKVTGSAAAAPMVVGVALTSVGA
jgi:hypothetical protein